MSSLLSSLPQLLSAPSRQAAWRTGFYGLASALLRGGGTPPTPAEQITLRRFLAEAFSFQRAQLGRADVARAVKILERRDLWQLPEFLISLPQDIKRARGKWAGGPSIKVSADDAFPYPDYYLHDFHNQANGGLSRRAAATYEWQIRLVFAGTNRLMRQGIIDALPTGDHLKILDVGCGTAAWVPQARLLGRHHQVTGVDLSPHYLREARRSPDPRAVFQQANAEALPKKWRGQFDRVVCIWLYHELPLAAQQQVTQEIARVLRPGGELLFMDAMQPKDVPEADIASMHQRFADDFDEPHFGAYQALDLDGHFAHCGLDLLDRRRLYVSNLLRLRRSGPQGKVARAHRPSAPGRARAAGAG